MRKSILTTGLVALSIPLLGGVALAAAHSVSSTPLTCPFGPLLSIPIHPGRLRGAETAGSNPAVPTLETPGRGRSRGRTLVWGSVTPGLGTR
jgi:hypothetical protein